MPTKTSAAPFLPPRLSLKSLREAAGHCQGCELYKNATQTVFGEGSRKAAVVLLGEVPGDEEDRQGHPFVGPAGRLLDDALDEAGLSQSMTLTSPTPSSTFAGSPAASARLHKKPTTRQIEACRPWLQAEILVVKPQVIVCLGATAAQSMLGNDFRITKQCGKFFASEQAAWIMATYHPSAILRAPDKQDREQKRFELVQDLQRAVKRVAVATKPR